MEWYEILISILSGLAVTIPLVIQLVKFVQQAVREKNWDSLLKFVMELLQEAESKFQDGASRKEWVIMMIKASADTINYDINLEQVSNLIDNLCAMSRVVNAPKETEEVK